MVPLSNVMDRIGGDDAVEWRQRETIGDVGLEEAKPGTGKLLFHGCAQRLQGAPLPIDGDDLGSGTCNVAECEREGAATGAEVGPDAAMIPCDSRLDQPHVIGVVHQTTPLGGLTWDRPEASMTLVY